MDPNVTKKYPDDLKKASEAILDSVKLDTALFRMGHTKARFQFQSNEI